MKSALFSVLGWLRGMPDTAGANLEAISRHVDRVLGQSAQHLHERYSPDIHVDLLHYSPTKVRDFHYVVTSGMSDRAMTNGGDAIDDARLELMIALPAEWDVSPQGFKDPATWAPIKLLKSLARYPHANRTFFTKGHSIPLGDDPLISPMKAALLMPPVLVPELGVPLESRGVKIRFLAVYLIHQNELDLKLRRFDELLATFAEREVTELYDLSRPSVLS